MSTTSQARPRTWADWTESDEARLRAWYALPRRTRPTQARLGRELGGRTSNAVSQRARLLGLTRRQPIDPDRLRALHAEGRSDAEIAVALGSRRATIRAARHRFGLPHNKLAPRQNARRGQAVRAFCRRDGIAGLHVLRTLAYRLEALRAGWPPEAGRGGTRLLDALEAAGGPLTARQLQRALGLKDRPRTTLANLERIGAVTVTRRRGGGGGNLYSLAVARRKPGPGRVG
jgi:hypothetical protein